MEKVAEEVSVCLKNCCCDNFRGFYHRK
jgi:hypothetical protein